MPYIVHWSEEARAGLERIYLFLEEKSEEAAIAAIKAIREKAVLIEQFPNAGRPSADLEPEQRELLVPYGAAGYVLMYEIYLESILILSVKHQKEAGYSFEP